MALLGLQFVNNGVADDGQAVQSWLDLGNKPAQLLTGKYRIYGRFSPGRLGPLPATVTYLVREDDSSLLLIVTGNP